MNIWIFNHYAIPPDLPGGTRHYDLGGELIKRGHQVAIFATSFHHYLHRETRLGPKERWRVEDVEGIKFVWIRTPSYQRNDWRRVWNMMSYALQSRRFGRKITRLAPEIGRPDVVIGSSPHLLAPLAAYCVAKHYRVGFVMEVRDLWPQTIIDMGELSERNPITRALQTLERLLYRRAEKIITLLPLGHEYITACGVPQKKVIWLPNGVDLSRFDYGAMPEVSHEGFRVLYLGAHGQANALDVLIQASKIVQDRGHREIRFFFVGNGPEKPKLMALARTLGLRNVEFREAVPKAEAPKTLHEADAFILNLEKAEVFRYGISSNKLFDYLAAGKAVIFSVNAPNNPVEEAHCGLTVPPRDPEALAKAVIQLSQMSA